MTLKTIRMELARSKENPEGDSGHAYEFRAPLNEAGQFDKAHWPEQKELCTVRRFEQGEDAERGLLIHTSGGNWMFSYAPGDDDDEALFRFSSHTFKPGEYISVTEHDGVQRTFKVVSVTDWHPA
ncbi:MAG: hypothetical protein RLN70_08275 [Rhodospirillaceae bacterium]